MRKDGQAVIEHRRLPSAVADPICAKTRKLKLQTVQDSPRPVVVAKDSGINAINIQFLMDQAADRSHELSTIALSPNFGTGKVAKVLVYKHRGSYHRLASPIYRRELNALRLFREVHTSFDILLNHERR